MSDDLIHPIFSSSGLKIGENGVVVISNNNLTLIIDNSRYFFYFFFICICLISFIFKLIFMLINMFYDIEI
jgi:hypothetical protein